MYLCKYALLVVTNTVMYVVTINSEYLSSMITKPPLVGAASHERSDLYSQNNFPYFMSYSNFSAPKFSSKNQIPILRIPSFTEQGSFVYTTPINYQFNNWQHDQMINNNYNVDLELKESFRKPLYYADIEPNFGYNTVRKVHKNYNPSFDSTMESDHTSTSDPIEVSNMSCDDADDGYFKAGIRWEEAKESIKPVFNDLKFGYVGAELCSIKVNQDIKKLSIDIKSRTFNICGVKNCTEKNGNRYLCLRLRFATVPGLKVSDDTTLTLRCRVQEQMITYTQRLGLSVNAAVLERNAGNTKNTVATGGASNVVHCQLQAFRLTDGQFSLPLRVGDVVFFGEDILLQINISHDNVWRWSRLSDIWLSSGSNSEEPRVPLLSPEGCALPQARAVCPEQPRQLGPFTYTLLLRAPMFTDSGLESSLHINVRGLACRTPRDCTSRCNRSSRALDLEIFSLNKTYHSKKPKYTKDYEYHNETTKRSKIADENLKRLTISSKAFEDDFRYESVSNKTVFNEMISGDNANVYNRKIGRVNDVAVEYLNDRTKKGKHASRDPNGSNYRRRRRDVRGETPSADSVAVLTFTVVQDEGRVTALTVNKAAANNDNVLYAILSISTIILILSIAIIIICREIRKQKHVHKIDFMYM